MALWDPYRRAGALHAKLPEPAPDKDYQLWIITPESKQPVDAGVIPAFSDCLTFTATRPVESSRSPRDIRRAERRFHKSAWSGHLSGETMSIVCGERIVRLRHGGVKSRIDV